jgi:hypothetical protein
MRAMTPVASFLPAAHRPRADAPSPKAALMSRRSRPRKRSLRRRKTTTRVAVGVVTQRSEAAQQFFNQRQAHVALRASGRSA